MGLRHTQSTALLSEYFRFAYARKGAMSVHRSKLPIRECPLSRQVSEAKRTCGAHRQGDVHGPIADKKPAAKATETVQQHACRVGIAALLRFVLADSAGFSFGERSAPMGSPQARPRYPLLRHHRGDVWISRPARCTALWPYRGAAAAQISSRARRTGVLHRAARGNDFVVD